MRNESMKEAADNLGGSEEGEEDAIIICIKGLKGSYGIESYVSYSEYYIKFT